MIKHTEKYAKWIAAMAVIIFIASLVLGPTGLNLVSKETALVSRVIAFITIAAAVLTTWRNRQNQKSS